MLSVHHLTRTFGRTTALDDASFDVPRGQLTGFVGGNGAGKTTSMRIIMGVLTPDRGTVTLDDAPVTRRTAREFGYMPEERGLYPRESAAEQIAYLGRLHGLSRAQAEGRAIALLDRLGLAARAYDKVESLSLGNQQRAQIAAALVHDPEVLILDEPFSGLDPLAVDDVMDLLQSSARRGAAVLFSSHQLDVVERIVDSVVIIADGRIRAAGPREDLLAAHAGQRHRLVAPAGGDLAWVGTVPGVSGVEFAPGRVEFDAPDDAAHEVLRRAVAAGRVQEFAPVRPTLAEVFKDVIQDKPDDAGGPVPPGPEPLGGGSSAAGTHPTAPAAGGTGVAR
ncbi:MAG: ATP-binding cassette domain-containing protein [Bifidobacteriaceae bacterium]|jgi:ABC-2 type transport system ATP-binding protein|nr:ATP-binding cassette domain-containing protein [Bifidobacteriaceae bacterium]